MIISIIQPCFVPWLGYFEQVMLADIFVYLDDVSYNRRNWRNNNQFKTPDGIKKFTVPVQKAPSGTLIKDIEIAHHLPWEENFYNALYNWYKKAPFYHQVMDFIHECMALKIPDLATFDVALNQSILNYLGCRTKIERSSNIPNNTSGKVERIAELCGYFEGVSLLFDGKSAQNFLHEDSFKRQGVKTVFQNYQHKEYPQLWGEFIPYMSILDCLFNCGPDAKKYIITESSWRSLFV